MTGAREKIKNRTMKRYIQPQTEQHYLQQETLMAPLSKMQQDLVEEEIILSAEGEWNEEFAGKVYIYNIWEED